MSDRISPVHRLYIITNSANEKNYIGLSSSHFLSSRFRGHRRRSREGCGAYLYRAMRKHGADNFKIEEIAQCHSREELIRLEKFWIGMLHSNEKDSGYNQTCGGEAPKHTEETKRKISKIQIGRKKSPEALANQLASLRTPEYRKLRSELSKRIANSKEYLDKVSGDNHWTRRIPRLESSRIKQSESMKRAYLEGRMPKGIGDKVRKAFENRFIKTVAWG